MINIGLVFVFIAISIAIGSVGGIMIYKTINNKNIGNAKNKSIKIIEDANIEAKNLKKESILEAKEEMHKLKIETDKEIKELKKIEN